MYRSCEQGFGANDTWRCFFAQDCHPHLTTPSIFHEYLYDSANLGFDGGSSPAEAEDFRARLEASFMDCELTSISGSGIPQNAVELPGLPPSSRTFPVLQAKERGFVQALTATSSTGAEKGLATQPGADAQPQGSRVEGGRQLLQHSDSSRTELPGQQAQEGARQVLRQPREGARQLLQLQEALHASSLGAAAAALPCDRLAGERMMQRQGTWAVTALEKRSHVNIFAPACHLHEMIDSDLFSKSHVGNFSFASILEAWYKDEINEIFLVDDHQGWRQGDECGYDPASAQQLSAIIALGA